MSNACFKRHGPDPADRKGGSDGLRLDTADGIRADLGDYAAIVPGEPKKGALVARITSNDPDELMPPPANGKKLSQHRDGPLSSGAVNFEPRRRPIAKSGAHC